MKKEKYELEYFLKSISTNILWNLIATPSGLSEWFADDTISSGNEYTFRWNDSEQKATLKNIRQNRYIRFQWEEDAGTDYFFEMRITKDELTSALSLIITDFAIPSDKEDDSSLWDKQIATLRQKVGL